MTNGALVTTVGADQSIPHSTNKFLSFTSVARDTDGFFNSNTPTRLTIPNGVSAVRLGGQMVWASNGTGLRQIVIKKNFPSGGGWFPGVPAINVVAAGGTTTDLACWTPVLLVQPGDFFELEAFHTAGAALNVLGSVGSWFTLEVVE